MRRSRVLNPRMSSVIELVNGKAGAVPDDDDLRLRHQSQITALLPGSGGLLSPTCGHRIPMTWRSPDKERPGPSYRIDLDLADWEPDVANFTYHFTALRPLEAIGPQRQALSISPTIQ